MTESYDVLPKQTIFINYLKRFLSEMIQEAHKHPTTTRYSAIRFRRADNNIMMLYID